MITMITNFKFLRNLLLILAIIILTIVGLYLYNRKNIVSQDDLLNHKVYGSLLNKEQIVKTHNFNNDFKNVVLKDFYEIVLNTESQFAKEYVQSGEYLTMNNDKLYYSMIELITKCFKVDEQKCIQKGIPVEVITCMSTTHATNIELFFGEVQKIIYDPTKTDIKYNSEKIYKIYNIVDMKWEKQITKLLSDKTFCEDDWKGLEYKGVKF